MDDNTVEEIQVMESEGPVHTAELTGTPGPNGDEAAGPLLSPQFVQDLRNRWDRIQTGFVDEPRAAVQQADELVASAVKKLAESFAEARNTLERQWDRADQVSTEDMRIVLKKYRSFFHKLMSV